MVTSSEGKGTQDCVQSAMMPILNQSVIEANDEMPFYYPHK